MTFYLVTPGLFTTMRTPVLAGRPIGEGDGRDAPWVAMVNESAARRLWPGEDPIEKQLLLDTVPDEQVRRIVGVVPDIPLRHGELVSQPVVYASCTFSNRCAPARPGGRCPAA